MHGALLALELALTMNLTSLSDQYPLRKGYAFVHTDCKQGRI